MSRHVAEGSRLSDHPGVEVISRDRGGAYVEGARRGAPQAEQVADRWHLMKNICGALENLLSRHRFILWQAMKNVRAHAGNAPVALPSDDSGNQYLIHGCSSAVAASAHAASSSVKHV